MKGSAALRIVADLASMQWGLVTTAQAAVRGVMRADLSRLTKTGHLNRVAQGIYRDAGAPIDQFEGIRAAWLAADPEPTAENRLRNPSDGATVMGASAAALHDAGDLPADRYVLSSPVRRQTQRPDVRYRLRRLDTDDVTIVQGLPTTTIERTIADLVEERTDLSLVADVLRDAARTRRIDTTRLSELLAPLAQRNNLANGDGDALLGRLNTLAGLDTAGLVRQFSTSDAISALAAASTLTRLDATFDQSRIERATDEVIQRLTESIARSVQQSIAPILDKLVDTVELRPTTRIDTALTDITERIGATLPTRELLASFGNEWARSLGQSLAVASTDLVPTINAIETARNAHTTAVRE